MNIKDKLREIVRYYKNTRQRGHTTSMLCGAVASPDCLIVTHNDEMGILLQKMSETKLNTISINSPSFLRGYNKPLMFDNAALMILLEQALNELEMTDKENGAADAYCPSEEYKRLEKELEATRLENERLQLKLYIIKNTLQL